MEISPAGVILIKHFEQFRSKKYKCSGGHWTIAWGHMITRNEKFPEGGVTRDEGEKLLNKDLSRFVDGVNEIMQVCEITMIPGDKVCKGQFDALVSFAFNVGMRNFKESTLVKKFVAGDIFGAAGEFNRWNRSGYPKIGYKGLIRRRMAETYMFLCGEFNGYSEIC